MTCVEIRCALSGCPIQKPTQTRAEISNLTPDLHVPADYVKALLLQPPEVNLIGV
jgi:hypothetical protein